MPEGYNTEKLIRSDREKVTFVSLPDFRGPAGLIKNYKQITSVIKKAVSMVDCIIFRVPSPIIMIGYSIVKKSRKPYVAEMVVNPRTAFSSESIKHVLQPIIQWYMTHQTKSICKNANGVAYVTEYTLQKEYPCASMIYSDNPNYFRSSYSTINLKEDDYEFREWSNNKPDEIVLVHCGAMGDYRKGQDIFINTVEELQNRGYKVKGILIGDGPIRYEFEQMSREKKVNVEFAGWKAGFKDVQQELLKGHFFVFPTASEGLPRSVIEAMASGLVCVGYAVDGMVELLNDDELVNERNELKFADCIENLIDDWDSILDKRRKLFEKSKKYNGNILQKKRSEFYTNLKSVTKEAMNE